MQCTPDKMFDYAVFLLQGDAYNWWKTVPDSLVQPPVLGWDDFLREYHSKYSPEVYRREKRREFIELKKNDMTVAEYELKFIQLLVYAANLIDTEGEKCLKFEEGLTYKIRSKLTPYDMETFPRLIAAAIRAEKLVNEKKTLVLSSEKVTERLEKRKEYQDSAPSGNNGNGGTSSKKRLMKPSSCSAQNQKDVDRKPRCPICGKRHFGECWRVTGKCNHCGSEEHQYRDCSDRPNISKDVSERTGQR